MTTNDPARSGSTRQTMTIRSIAAQPSGLGLVSVQPDSGDTNATSPPPTTERLVFTVDEAAYLLNISRSLAYELIARGELPALRLGRRIVIPRVTLEELLETALRWRFGSAPEVR
jgi:excisionase family DNA binding protein